MSTQRSLFAFGDFFFFIAPILLTRRRFSRGTCSKKHWASNLKYKPHPVDLASMTLNDLDELDGLSLAAASPRSAQDGTRGFFDFPHLLSFDVLDLESDDESSDEELPDLVIDDETPDERRKSRKSFAKVGRRLCLASLSGGCHQRSHKSCFEGRWSHCGSADCCSCTHSRPGGQSADKSPHGVLGGLLHRSGVHPHRDPTRTCCSPSPRLLHRPLARWCASNDRFSRSCNPHDSPREQISPSPEDPQVSFSSSVVPLTTLQG
jgi:hypothetical protein